jgi:hypothetical protein
MTGLEFTSEAAKQLEKVYLTKDIIAQTIGNNSATQFV